jgi:ABC-type glycerol-3-phosphate transport system permease component
MVKALGRRRRRPTGSDVAFDAANTVFLALVCIVTLYPLVYVVSASLSSPAAVSRGAVWLFPVEPSLRGYQAVFANRDVVTGYANSMLYMVTGTLLNVSITLTAACALAQRQLPGGTLIMVLFTFTPLFSGGIIPLYLVVRATIGVNNRWDMILPNAMSVGNPIIARTFMRQNLPTELRESAKIDGSDDFRFFFSVALPLSGPIIGVMTMLYAVTHWNSFFFAFVFLTSKSLCPLQIILRNILIISEIATDSFGNLEYLARIAGMMDLLKFAVIVVASVPVLILYPFVQRHFVRCTSRIPGVASSPRRTLTRTRCPRSRSPAPPP